MGTWSIKSDGRVVLTPENDTEAFALEMWSKHICKDENVFVNAEMVEAFKNTKDIPTLK